MTYTDSPSHFGALVEALDKGENNPESWRAFWAALPHVRKAPDHARFLQVLAKVLPLERVEREILEAAALLQVRRCREACGSDSTFVKWCASDGGDAVTQAGRALVCAYFSWASFGGPAAEEIVVSARRELLLRQVGGSLAALPQALNITAAIAIYAFLHEYVFAETDEERSMADGLLARVSSDASTNPLRMAVIAMYQPLRRLPDSEYIGIELIPYRSAPLCRLVQLDIDDGIEEEKLRAHISQLTPISDDTSQAVREQYEENPYPRWTFEWPPAVQSEVPSTHSKILIAGCGTNQALLTAINYPRSDILAVDLSLTSLAYAKRMTAKHQCRNIEFRQADILALGGLSEKFDLIECTGVLHHLKDPGAGLKVLRDRLAPNGRLRIAVYAASGRRAVPHAILLREQLGLGSSLADIRKLRAAVMALPQTAPAFGVTRFRDFYFSSACRDLIFHVQEYNYDLPGLAELVESAGLTIASLKVPKKALAFFRERFPQGDPQRDFEKWHDLETERENLFGPMYYVSLQHRAP